MVSSCQTRILLFDSACGFCGDNPRASVLGNQKNRDQTLVGATPDNDSGQDQQILQKKSQKSFQDLVQALEKILGGSQRISHQYNGLQRGFRRNLKPKSALWTGQRSSNTRMDQEWSVNLLNLDSRRGTDGWAVP